MKVLFWNLKASESPDVVRYLSNNSADILVLPEYGIRPDGRLAEVLRRRGYRFQVADLPRIGRKGILLASRYPIKRLPLPVRTWAQREGARRMIHVSIPDGRLSLLGVY